MTNLQTNKQNSESVDILRYRYPGNTTMIVFSVGFRVGTTVLATCLILHLKSLTQSTMLL